MNRLGPRCFEGAKGHDAETQTYQYKKEKQELPSDGFYMRMPARKLRGFAGPLSSLWPPESSRGRTPESTCSLRLKSSAVIYGVGFVHDGSCTSA